MINLRQELANYPQINLKNLEESGIALPDNIKNSVILYNKALDGLRSNSEDIAVIELKKAIALNPGFYEAMNLLGLCYACANDMPKAVEMFEKVVAAENNSVKALRYLSSLNDNTDNYKASSRLKRKDSPKTAETKNEESRSKTSLISLNSSKKRDVLKVLIGFTAGALLIFFLGLPGRSDRPTVPDSSVDSKKLMDESIAAYEAKLSKLNEDYENLKKDYEAAGAVIDQYKFAAKLSDAENLVLRKKYIEAADMLILLKVADFKGPEKEKYDGLFREVMPIAAKAAFESGFKLYHAGKYDEALKSLNKVQVYMDNYDAMDRVLYYIGKSYKELNDSRSAIAAYQKIMDNYPGGTYAKYAEFRIKELTQMP